MNKKKQFVEQTMALSRSAQENSNLWRPPKSKLMKALMKVFPNIDQIQETCVLEYAYSQVAHIWGLLAGGKPFPQ